MHKANAPCFQCSCALLGYCFLYNAISKHRFHLFLKLKVIIEIIHNINQVVYSKVMKQITEAWDLYWKSHLDEMVPVTI